MTIRPAVVCALLSLAPIGALVAQEDGATKLRYRFESGSEAWLQIDQSLVMDVKMRGQSVQSTMSSKTFLHLKVTAVEGDVATLEATLQRVTGTMNMAMRVMHFDTEDESSVPPQFESFLDLIGKPVNAKIDTRGQVVGVAGGEAGDKAAPAAGGLDLEQMLQKLSVVLPADPVAVGGTWTSSYSMQMGPKTEVEMKVHDKLTALEGRIATVEQHAELGELPEDAPKMKLESSEGTAVVDLDQGLPKSSTMTMDMVVSGGGMVPGEMHMKSTLEARRVDAEAAKADLTDADAAGATDAEPPAKKPDDGGDHDK